MISACPWDLDRPEWRRNVVTTLGVEAAAPEVPVAQWTPKQVSTWWGAASWKPCLDSVSGLVLKYHNPVRPIRTVHFEISADRQPEV